MVSWEVGGADVDVTTDDSTDVAVTIDDSCCLFQASQHPNGPGSCQCTFSLCTHTRYTHTKYRHSPSKHSWITNSNTTRTSSSRLENSPRMRLVNRLFCRGPAVFSQNMAMLAFSPRVRMVAKTFIIFMNLPSFTAHCARHLQVRTTIFFSLVEPFLPALASELRLRNSYGILRSTIPSSTLSFDWF